MTSGARRMVLGGLAAVIATLGNGCGDRLKKHVVEFQQVVIEGVAIVDLDSGRVLPDRTIFVADGLIQALGASGESAVPPGTPTIDGRGRFVIPGLADMHVHHYTPSGTARSPYSDADLLLYLVNGVTTVRNMTGSELDLVAKRRIGSGELLGPHYYSCSPHLGYRLNPDDAAQAAEEYARAGYDCIKIYSGIPHASFQAMIRAAERLGIPAVGHAQPRLGLDETLTLRSVEHLEEVLGFFGDPPLDQTVCAQVARRFAERGVFVTPTLSVFAIHKYLSTSELAEIVRRPETRFVSEHWYAIASETDGEAYRYVRRQTYEYHRRRYENGQEVVRCLSRHGVALLLGTDLGVLLAPGFAVHEELEALVEAGLTPLAALRSGTSNVAAFLGDSYNGGRFQAGRSADLVLLDGNPLVDIRHTRRIAGVMIGRHWISASAIGEILERLRKR